MEDEWRDLKEAVISRKTTLSASKLGHWWNDCAGRTSMSCENSTCAKSWGPEGANNENTTKGPQRFLEGDCGRDREDGGLGLYKETFQILKRVNRRPAGADEVLLKRDGSVIPDQARGLCHWKEHCRELLNHPAPPNTPFHQRILPQQNSTHLRLTLHP